jgi:hypothetical protein
VATAMASRKGRSEFGRKEIESLLVACHRRCCICHCCCGVKIEVHHIESATTPASGRIENAIPLCCNCHAEVCHYNPKHPKGRKLTPGELRRHKEQCLGLCREHPEMFVASQQPAEAGSLERLASELTFNLRIANYAEVPFGRSGRCSKWLNSEGRSLTVPSRGSPTPSGSVSRTHA